MYAYLTIACRGCDVVHFPDGRVTVTEAGNGDAAVASWKEIEAAAPENDPQSGHPASAPGHADLDAGAESAQSRYEEAVALWEAELARRLEGILSVTQGREIREAYEAEFPRPEMADGTAPVTDGDPSVEQAEWWVATCPEPAIRVPLAPSCDALPRAPLAKVLSDLEHHGWSVIQVSEERVVQHDETHSRPIVVEASILIHK